MPGGSVNRLRKASVSLCIPSVCKLHIYRQPQSQLQSLIMTHNNNDLPRCSRRKLNLADLKLSPDLFQPRERGVDSEHVKALAAALRRGCKFEPLDVWEDPAGTLILVHGHHRHQAYLQLGRRRVVANVYRCSLAEVRLVSIAANSQDRLPLSTSERSQFAWRSDCEHKGVFSADLLATSAGISRRSVYNMRKVRERLVKAGVELPLLWCDAKAAVSTRAWPCSAEEREAIFRERRARLREKIIGPIG